VRDAFIKRMADASTYNQGNSSKRRQGSYCMPNVSCQEAAM